MKKQEIKTTIEELEGIPQEIAYKLQDRSNQFEKELQNKTGLTAEHIIKSSLIEYIDDCIKIFKDAKKKTLKVNTAEDEFVDMLNDMLKDFGKIVENFGKE